MHRSVVCILQAVNLFRVYRMLYCIFLYCIRPFIQTVCLFGVHGSIVLCCVFLYDTAISYLHALTIKSQLSTLYSSNTIDTSTITPVHPHHSALNCKPIKRIQKNKKTAYAHVDPVALRPLQQYPGAQAPHDSRCQAHLTKNRIFETREYLQE